MNLKKIKFLMFLGTFLIVQKSFADVSSWTIQDFSEVEVINSEVKAYKNYTSKFTHDGKGFTISINQLDTDNVNSLPELFTKLQNVEVFLSVSPSDADSVEEPTDVSLTVSVRRDWSVLKVKEVFKDQQNELDFSSFLDQLKQLFSANDEEDHDGCEDCVASIYNYFLGLYNKVGSPFVRVKISFEYENDNTATLEDNTTVIDSSVAEDSQNFSEDVIIVTNDDDTLEAFEAVDDAFILADEVSQENLVAPEDTITVEDTVAPEDTVAAEDTVTPEDTVATLEEPSSEVVDNQDTADLLELSELDFSETNADDSQG